MSDLDLDELRAELAEFAQPEKKGGRSPREERIIAGFEEIQRFVESTAAPRSMAKTATSSSGSMPCASTGCARLRNAVRFLRRSTIKGFWPARQTARRRARGRWTRTNCLPNWRARQAHPTSPNSPCPHQRRKARSRGNRQPPEVRGLRRFKPLFLQVQKDIETGVRQTRPFELKAEIRPGSWFIVGGQKAYVAEMGEMFTNAQGRTDARLRVIFDNGTESNMLHALASAGAAQGRSGPADHRSVAGPLFSDEHAEDDQASGTIYVLRSKSDHPVVAANRDLVHKIGVTNVNVEQRIAGARLEPTFLMADVEIVATYELYNINRTKLENLIHRIFDPARLDIEIKDRFGNPVVPARMVSCPAFRDRRSRRKD